VDVLYERVLPFYEKHKLPTQAVLTDNGTEYRGRPMIHFYEIFLEFNDIEHRTTKVGNLRTNAFVGRFNRILLDDFLECAFAKILMNPLKLYNLIWMPGFIIITMNVPTVGIETWAGVLSRQSS
jgi:transposase InsO family protein